MVGQPLTSGANGQRLEVQDFGLLLLVLLPAEEALMVQVGQLSQLADGVDHQQCPTWARFASGGRWSVQQNLAAGCG